MITSSSPRGTPAQAAAQAAAAQLAAGSRATVAIELFSLTG
jgi:hypothetical protein